MNTFIENISDFSANDGTTARPESNYTFTPTSATQSASDLNTLNTNASNISLTNVTAFSASDMTDLSTFHSNIGGFTLYTGIATITLTDNGGSGSSVDYTTLKSIVDNYQ